MLRRLLKLLLILLCNFLILELGVRALFTVGPAFRRIRGTDDSSRRIDWIKQHSSGKTFTYKFDVYDAVRGWAVKPGLHNATVFDNKILNSNSRGLRGQVEYEYARQPGKRRIVTLGDSYTFGDEVSDDETYSRDLATLVPGTEVLNMGVHGYGQDQMLLYFENEGVKYHPDVVILGYVWFDMIRNMLAFNDFAKPRFELKGSTLQLTNVPVPTPEEVMAREPFRLKTVDLMVMAKERVRWEFGWNQRRAENLTFAILDQLVETTKKSGGVPVFVYLPVLQEIVDPRAGLTQNEKFLDQFCRARDIACLFLRPYFTEQVREGKTFNTRSHWLGPEHMLAAQEMRDFLAQKNLVTPPPSVQAGASR